ncbi:MAG TPA: ATP-binding protein [Solirubrobacterales bacterium]|nr:ATP-binding protein [Solirubrobacterales bacterium]
MTAGTPAEDDAVEALEPEDPPAAADAFDGEIKVASRIVDYLSSGLYESPAACLKELVNNSYDADAKKVEVYVKPGADQIIVVDDGLGLTRDEFIRHFERVSESHKRDKRGTTPSGRPLVGRIGIGLIAANELCDEMEIVSTKKGQSELLRVTIDFEAMRLDPAGGERRDAEGDGDEFKKGDYSGWVEKAKKGDHYTRIYLRRIRDHARLMFAGIPHDAETAGDDSLYGLKPETIVGKLEDSNLRSWSEFDEYSQTMLEVGLNVPVRYAPGWIPSDVKRRVSDFEDQVEEGDFTVMYDGTDLRKPTVLRGPEGHFLRRFAFEGESVNAIGYFFAKRRALVPQELNGVLIRIRRAAVGDYDPSWLDYRATLNPLFQSWISAEIWADDGLEDALNIDRRTLRVTHPAFVELQAAFHKSFSKVLSEARDVFYTKRSATRRADQAREQVQRMKSIASEHGVSLPPTRTIKDLNPGADEGDNKRAIRRAVSTMTVSEVYELALEVARSELSEAQYRKFANALAQRLLE